LQIADPAVPAIGDIPESGTVNLRTTRSSVIDDVLEVQRLGRVLAKGGGLQCVDNRRSAGGNQVCPTILTLKWQ